VSDLTAEERSNNSIHSKN